MTSVLNSSIVSAATSNNSESDEDVTCGERMGGDSDRLTSAVASSVSSTCGRGDATEKVCPLGTQLITSFPL